MEEVRKKEAGLDQEPRKSSETNVDDLKTEQD